MFSFKLLCSQHIIFKLILLHHLFSFLYLFLLMGFPLIMWYIFCFLTCIVILTGYYTVDIDSGQRGNRSVLAEFHPVQMQLSIQQRLNTNHMQSYKELCIVPYSLKFFSTISSYPRLPGFLSLFLNSSSAEENSCDLLIVLSPALRSGMLSQTVNEVVTGFAYFSSREHSPF